MVDTYQDAAVSDARLRSAVTKQHTNMAQSQRMGKVQTPVIPVVGEWVAQHPGTISLGQGIVHYPPLPEVGQAVAAAAAKDPRLHRYGLVRGIDELLEEIEKKLASENGIDVSRQCCVVTAGSNMGFQNSILAIGDVDDEVILLSPFYFNH